MVSWALYLEELQEQYQANKLIYYLKIIFKWFSGQQQKVSAPLDYFIHFPY